MSQTRISPVQSAAMTCDSSWVKTASSARSPNGFELALLAAVLVPEPDHAVAAGREQPPVLGEPDRGGPAAVGAERLDVAAVLHLPELDRAVFAGRGDDVRVEPPAHVGDGRLVAAQVEELAAGLRFPDDQAVVAVAGREQDAVGAELGGGDPLGVLAHLLGQRAVGRVVDPDDLAGPAEGDLAVVGADVGRQDDVVFLADLEDARPLLDVPGDRDPGLAAAAAAGQQQVAVAAELEDVDRPFGKRQHADQVVIGRPVEQHLLVPGDRDQRRPGARRHRHDRAGLGLGDERLGRQVLGHRRRARRLAQRGGVELELELRLGLGRRHAAGVLERTPFDPLADQLDLGVGDLGRVGRHLGLFLVRDHQEERAVVGIARLDHLARAASLHRRAVVVEVQAPLLLVGVVARAAAAAKDGRHVVLVGDLRLGRVGGEADRQRRPRHENTSAESTANASFDRMVRSLFWNQPGPARRGDWRASRRE